MYLHFHKSLRALVLMVALPPVPPLSAQAENPATFVLTVSPPEPTMRVGDDLVVDVITTNPTDHVIYAGEGGRVGLAVELLNEKSEDIGLHAMGIPGGKIQDTGGTFAPIKIALRPGSKDQHTWRFKPEPGYVVPGVYKLRVYQRDMTSKAEVYSNSVVLTVIP